MRTIPTINLLFKPHLKPMYIMFSGMLEIFLKSKLQIRQRMRLGHLIFGNNLCSYHRNWSKVKNCTRVLSKTVAAALSYTSQFSHYSDGREVSDTLKNTAEIVSFFDDLFDSCNGAALRTKGKDLRKAVTKKSSHHAFWQKAIDKLKDMKFVDPHTGQVPRVPPHTLKNWLVTLKSMQRLWQFFESKNIKIMRTRYFNSDPIENFFGQVRAYNFRNNDPNCHNFTQTFRSLLITRFIKFHSEGFNCEEDSGCQIIKIKPLFEKTEVPEPQRSVAVTDSVLEDYMRQENIQLQARRERLHVHSRAYSAGWLVGKILKKVDCPTCRENLTTEETSIHRWINHREYKIANKRLNYPSEYAVRLFGLIVKTTNEYLDKEPHRNYISQNIRKLVLDSPPTAAHGLFRFHRWWLFSDLRLNHKRVIILILFN
ncbi:uncharacterized protein LOC133533228 [Cydia pomonella]|uniref:uncharacterized protein LOC133533228 n=1 Tax=Cydia pomonella TaxID=82600 RepID=UPI002ADD71DF|nr:uncharacterized protein LOC133533228 [Cydia pomonella]